MKYFKFICIKLVPLFILLLCFVLIWNNLFSVNSLHASSLRSNNMNDYGESTQLSTQESLKEIRTLVYHQITKLEPMRGMSYSIISDNGNYAVSGLQVGGANDPNPVYLINLGNATVKQVDSYPVPGWRFGNLCDISADGSRVVTSGAYTIRIANASGSVGQELTAFHSNEIHSVRITDDGTKIFFLLRRDNPLVATNKKLERGIYVISSGGGRVRKIVGATEVARFLGVQPGDVFPFDGNGPSLDISNDGRRIVFAAHNKAIGKVQGGNRIYGINSDGSGLHQIFGPCGYLSVGISGNGSKVAFNVISQQNVEEGWTANFDGGNRIQIGDQKKFRFTDANSRGDRISLTEDGSRVMLTSQGWIINSDGSGYFNVWNKVGPHPATLGGGWQVSMDAQGRRVLYRFRDERNRHQLGIVDINPQSLNGAPSLTDPNFDPSFLPPTGQSLTTATVKVSPSGPLVGNKSALSWYRNNIYEPPAAHLWDDGSHGDKQPGDGVYTHNVIYPPKRQEKGPRNVRFRAEIIDNSNLHHATAIEYSPFWISETPPEIIEEEPPVRPNIIDDTPTQQEKETGNACGFFLGSGIFNKWKQMGGESGILGCPIMNETEAESSPQGTTGKFVEFSSRDGGYIIWHRNGFYASRAFEVHGCIFKLYKSLGGTNSWLGFPVKDESDIPGGRVSNFEGGYIIWDAQTSRCYPFSYTKKSD